MKSNTKNTKHGGRRPLKTIYPFHEEWRKTYPSFIERGTSEQLASNKLDSRSSLGYHRTNGKVQQRSRFVGPTHITNARNVHIVHSSKRAARRTLESKPISPTQVPCKNLKKVGGKAVASPGDRDPQPEEPTSNKQSTSEQTLKHSGPRYTSNGRASKAIPQ